MKIIELLNKMSENEEIPKTFKYNDYIFNLGDDKRYRDQEGDYLVEHISYNFRNLNDKIEIIEDTPKENKKIEELEEKYYHAEPALIDDTAHKINEIIRRVNNENI